MRDPVHLAAHEWPAGRPFTRPGLASRDCDILIGLIRDLHASRAAPAQPGAPRRGRDRLIVTDAGSAHMGEAVSIVGFFGERNGTAGDEIADQVELVNAAMVEDFDRFPLLLGYVSRLLDDGFNYANLVVLAGADGIEKWRDMPDHVSAARDLAPEFYASVRIYNGSLASGLGQAHELKLHTVKYWDYRSGRVWHATRELEGI